MATALDFKWNVICPNRVIANDLLSSYAMWRWRKMGQPLPGASPRDRCRIPPLCPFTYVSGCENPLSKHRAGLAGIRIHFGIPANSTTTCSMPVRDSPNDDQWPESPCLFATIGSDVGLDCDFVGTKLDILPVCMVRLTAPRAVRFGFEAHTTSAQTVLPV